MKTKKCQAMGIKELIATLVVSGLLMIIGIYVFAKVEVVGKSTLTGGNYSAATATVSTITGTAYDSFELATVALIVLAAAVIIGILIRAFSG